MRVVEWPFVSTVPKGKLVRYPLIKSTISGNICSSFSLSSRTSRSDVSNARFFLFRLFLPAQVKQKSRPFTAGFLHITKYPLHGRVSDIMA